MDKQPQVPRSCRRTSLVQNHTTRDFFQNIAVPIPTETRGTSAVSPVIRLHTHDDRTEVEKQNMAMLLACAFFVGAFLGVVVETLWGILKLHTLERRSGLLFFPIFNPVYGAGAILLTLAKGTTETKEADDWKTFCRSTLYGAALEYIISFVQQKTTGSVSWDYSAMALNIGGRIHLLYCLAWGTLGLLWIKVMLPPLERISRKLDTNVGRTLMLVAVLLLCIDLACSGLAIYRWSKRTRGIPAQSVAGQYYDQRYPDSVMKRYYPNLKFVSDHY